MRESGGCKFDRAIYICRETHFAVLLVRMNRSTFMRFARIVTGLFCLNAQLSVHAQSAPTNLWTFPIPPYCADASPAIAPDGTIYQGTFQGHLLAVTPQGGKKWDFRINSEIHSSPAIADDGTIYFGARDRKLYALTPEGKLKWTFKTGAWIDSSPAIGS